MAFSSLSLVLFFTPSLSDFRGPKRWNIKEARGLCGVYAPSGIYLDVAQLCLILVSKKKRSEKEREQRENDEKRVCVRHSGTRLPCKRVPAKLSSVPLSHQFIIYYHLREQNPTPFFFPSVFSSLSLVQTGYSLGALNIRSAFVYHRIHSPLSTAISIIIKSHLVCHLSFDFVTPRDTKSFFFLR